MKRNTSLSVVIFLITTLFLSNLAFAKNPDRTIERITFSENILSALQSENIGLKVSAMQKVVKYKDLVDINKSVLALVRVYRNSYDEKMRKLALVTIYSLQNDWAFGILKRDVDYEKSPVIKNLMIAVLNNDFEKFKESKEITAFLQ